MTSHPTSHPTNRRATGGGRPRSARRSRQRGEGGSVAVEMAVLVLPVAATMTAVAVFAAHLVATRFDMNAAAAAAARAASLTRTTTDAQAAATGAAAADLAAHHRTCSPLQVSLDTSAFTPGGQVTVTVHCTMTNSDLSGWSLPGTSTSSSTAHAVIDTWRGNSLGSPTSAVPATANPGGGRA